MPTIKIIGSIETAETVIYSNAGNFIINSGANIGRFASGTLFRSYMRFDIPNIKGKVLDAKLGLTSSGGQSSSTTFSLHRVTESWVVEGVSANTEPLFAPEFISKRLYSGQSGYFEGLNLLVDGMVNGSIPNYGFHIKSQFENAGDSITFWGIDATNVNERPYLEITYNESPTKPTLIEPNGGESFGQIQAITFTGSTDIESDPIKYQVQLSVNNGSTWRTLTSDATTSPYNYNFNNETETSQALMRIRAYDGYSYSDWDVSDGIFTIRHNVAPSIPSNLTPSGIPVDRLKTRRLTWQHNDSPNDIQSKADIHWRHQGDTLWTSLVSDGPDQEYFIPPNTFPNGQTEWRVRTYDSTSIVSPWSNVAVFTSAEPTNAPTIIQPTGSVSVPRPIVEWTSATQSAYQLVVEDSLGIVVWDTGEITSTVKARTADVDLLNGGTYKVKVRIKDGSGLFSSFADVTFVVSYTPPAKPNVQVYPAEGAIAISIDNPSPTGTQPSVLYSDVYRDFDGVWVRIATNVNVAFTDYAVASGTTYKYRIQTHGNNGTSSYSDVVSASVTVKGAWIHAVRDAESTAINFRYNGVGYETEFTPESVAIKFAGRRRPVIQFGVYEDYSLSVTIQSVDGMDDMNRLRSFVRNRELICYRDSDGNLLYGIIPSLPITKEYRVSSASITIIETEFNEEV